MSLGSLISGSLVNFLIGKSNIIARRGIKIVLKCL